jgi:hypothetical protein
LASVEEHLTARSRGWISDGFATVAITLHLAKSLQQLESDPQQHAKCRRLELLQPRSAVDHHLHNRLRSISETIQVGLSVTFNKSVRDKTLDRIIWLLDAATILCVASLMFAA